MIVEVAAMSPHPQLQLGYYLNPKKLKKFGTQSVFDFPYRNDIKFQFVDFSNDISAKVCFEFAIGF